MFLKPEVISSPSKV